MIDRSESHSRTVFVDQVVNMSYHSSLTSWSMQCDAAAVLLPSLARIKMSTTVWVLALLSLGLATGKITGAGLAFTHGRTVHDLAAGLLGAVIAGVPLRLAGLSGYSAALPTLLVGIGAAGLATWITRIVTWQREPILRPADDSSDASNGQHAHDVMTTSDGTRLLLSAGRLVVPGAGEVVTRPS